MKRLSFFLLAALLLVAPVAQARNAVGTAVGSKATVQPTWPEDVPKPLSDADAKLYAELFDLQRHLRRTEVARKLSALEDKRTLMGHLIGIRLLHPLTKTPYGDLKVWLDHYHDHSNAPAVYELAKSREPNARDLRNPSVSRLSAARYSDSDGVDNEEPPTPTLDSSSRQKLLRRLRYYRVNARYNNSISELMKNHNIALLGEDTWGQVSVKLTRSMLHDAQYDKAIGLMAAVDERLGMRQPAARWLQGYAEYRKGNVAAAAALWRTLAYDLPTNSRYYAQASWWAATAYGNLGRHAMSRVFFNMAAQDTYTFYGMLANERLGREDLLRWRAPRLDPVALEELLADKGVQRTLALAQIGEYGLAQAELRASYERIPYQYDETLLALALKLNLANTAMTLARNLQEQEKTYLLGLYPLIEQWVPSGHVQVDPALLHAIIRQESAFDPGVVSSAGARGLMQLMPNTATYIARMNGKNPYPRYRLYEPSANTELGQDYLIYLQQKMGNNLLAMISAYNAGPGNVGKWLADERVGTEDPLLFIESIPFSETRNYLKKVLTNYWLYRRQFGAPTPTLKSLSHNQWPEAFLEPIEYEVSQEIKRLAPSVSRPTVFTGGKKPLTEERSEPLKTLPAAPVPEQSNDPDYEDILQPPSL